jgi:cytidine deaminase
MNNNDKNLEILSALFELAKRHERTFRAQTVSAVVYKKSILFIGQNSKKTHPLQKAFGNHFYSIYMHAEAAAIIKAKKYLSEKQLTKSTLFVVRAKMDNDGKYHWGMARPCPSCVKIAKEFGLSKVVYTLEGTGNYSLERIK